MLQIQALVKLVLGKCVPTIKCRMLSPLSIKVQGQPLKRPRLSMHKNHVFELHICI